VPIGTLLPRLTGLPERQELPTSSNPEPNRDFATDAGIGTHTPDTLPRADYPQCFVDFTAAVVTRPAQPLEGEDLPVDEDPRTGTITFRTRRTISERTSQLVTGVVPIRASFTRRTFKQAGETEITISGAALPFHQFSLSGFERRVLRTLGRSGAAPTSGDVSPRCCST
jgi:hypothetical protein